MTLKHLLELAIEFGPWVTWALAPLILPLLFLTQRRWILEQYKWIHQQLRARPRSHGRVLAACLVIAALLYYVVLFRVYDNRGLPGRFDDGVVGILIAPVSSSEEQQFYQQTIQTFLYGASELQGKVEVALLERELPEDEDEAHRVALKLGRRVNAAFVLRAIRLGMGETIQHQVWLTVVDQPDLLSEANRIDMGLTRPRDLIELDKYRLPSNVTLLARCVLAVVLYRANSYAEAVKQFAALLDQPETEGLPERSDLWLLYGSVQYFNGEYQAAVASLGNALELRDNDATYLNNLALALLAVGRFQDAEQQLQRALEIRESEFGANRPETATIIHNLAGLYYEQGRYGEAEPLLQSAVSIMERELGPNHPTTAMIIGSLAELYRSQRRDEEADSLFKRALRILDNELRSDHPQTAALINNLALLNEHQGNLEEAESLYRRSLATREQRFGFDHPETAISLHNLAEFYRSRGRYEEAEPLFKRAIAIRQKALPEHVSTAVTLNKLAHFHSIYRP